MFVVKIFKNKEQKSCWKFNDEYYAKKTKAEKEKEGYVVTITQE